MNEQIKQKLSDLFRYELKQQINFDDVFSVSVELKNNNGVWFVDADMMAESGGRYPFFDYDSPPEFKPPCISCKYVMAYRLDETMFPTYFEDEAYEIVIDAIKTYKP